MQSKSLQELNEIHDLELENIVSKIKKSHSRRVLLQFPDGMKPFSTLIASEVSSKANCLCFIWFGSCYGGCDLPLEVSSLGIDLIIQFGHSAWNFEGKGVEVI